MCVVAAVRAFLAVQDGGADTSLSPGLRWFLSSSQLQGREREGSIHDVRVAWDTVEKAYLAC